MRIAPGLRLSLIDRLQIASLEYIAGSVRFWFHNSHEFYSFILWFVIGTAIAEIRCQCRERFVDFIGGQNSVFFFRIPLHQFDKNK